MFSSLRLDHHWPLSSWPQWLNWFLGLWAQLLAKKPPPSHQNDPDKEHIWPCCFQPCSTPHSSQGKGQKEGNTYEGLHAPSAFQTRPTALADTPHSLFASKSVDFILLHPSCLLKSGLLLTLSFSMLSLLETTHCPRSHLLWMHQSGLVGISSITPMYLFSRIPIAKCFRLHGLNNKNLFSPPRCQQSWFFPRPLSLSYRWSFSSSVFTWSFLCVCPCPNFLFL